MPQLKLLILFLFCSTSVWAEEGVFESVGKDLLSPVTTEAKYYFYSGVALSLTLAVLENQISDPMQKEVIEERPLGNFATELGVWAGSGAPNWTYAAGFLGYGLLAKDTGARDRGNLMLRATLYAQGLTTVLKHTVREPRPDASKERVSFPSGHTTNAFSFASVIAMEHGPYWGALTYSYATLVAYSRMNDNRHFFHDVIGGAAIGISYGVALYHRIHQTHLNEEPDDSKLVVLVSPADQLRGAVGYVSFQF